MKGDPELLNLLTAGKEMSYDEEKSSLETVLAASPQVGAQLCRVFLDQKHRLKAALSEARKSDDELRRVIQKLSEPPWYPGDFLRYSARHSKATVTSGGRKVAVSIAPELQDEVEGLTPGSEVYLSHELNVIVAIGDCYCRSGEIAAFDRFDRGRAVLKGQGDQEIVVDVAAELASAELKPGDRILFDRETRIAHDRIERTRGEQYFIQETPEVTFDQIGGLDGVLADLLDEIELHLFHGHLVRQHQLERAKGVILCGPPGCGKTLIAKSLANYVDSVSYGGGLARFINIKPGSQRSLWYGQTEANIREIFRVATETAWQESAPVVVFMDELDNIGARSGDFVNAIDSRVLTAFLAEIDGLEATGNVFLIGATNRADLLDEALLRPGRFGDRVFQIPRPSRDAAKEIFGKYVTPGLPFSNGNGASAQAMAEEIIEAAVCHVYSPRGEGNLLATLTLRDGKKQQVHAPEVMSGAIIANVVREAKRRSCARGARGERVGIVAADVLDALDGELETIALRLKKTRHIHTLLTELPADVDVVKVEIHTRSRTPRTYDFVHSER